MTLRLKRLLAIIATLFFLVVYVLLAMAFASFYLVGSGFWVQLAGFIVLGFVWLPMVMAIITWAVRPPPDAK